MVQEQAPPIDPPGFDASNLADVDVLEIEAVPATDEVMLRQHQKMKPK